MEENRNWTVAWRVRRANRILRATDWAGTWDEASEMASKIASEHPELQVWYVPTRESELAGRVPAEDVGNVLTGTGRRVRIIDGGKLADMTK